MYYTTDYTWSTLYGFEWCVSLLQCYKLQPNIWNQPSIQSPLLSHVTWTFLQRLVAWWYFSNICFDDSLMIFWWSWMHKSTSHAANKNITARLSNWLCSSHPTLIIPHQQKNRAPKATAWMAGIRAPECTAWLRSVLAQRRSSSRGSLGKNKRSNAWLSSNWLASTWRVGSPSKDRWLVKGGTSAVSRSTRSLGGQQRSSRWLATYSGQKYFGSGPSARDSSGK